MVGIDEYFYRAEWTHQTIHEPVFDNSRHAVRTIAPGMSEVLTQPPFRRHVEVVTQCQPHFPEVVPLFDKLPRGRAEARQNMTPGDPATEGIAELPVNQSVELRASHAHHANRHPGPRRS